MKRPLSLPLRVLLVWVTGITLALATTGAFAAGNDARAERLAAPDPSAKPEPASEGPYLLDPKRSTFQVLAEAGGVLAAFAHDHHIQIRDFSGTVNLSPGSVETASLDLSIKADSLTLTDKVSEKDRHEIEGTMKGKVLETAKFPKISFRSSAITATKKGDASYWLQVNGTLSLHGVDRKVTLPVSITLKGNSVRAAGTFKLRQTDYGITPVSAAVGTIKVKDEVTLSFDIVASRP
jgi:polyisoprenoid-binding protein YceI